MTEKPEAPKVSELSPGREPEDISVVEMVVKPLPIDGTLLGRAMTAIALEEQGGRFSVAPVVTGASPAPRYGAGPQWSRDLNLPGDEEALGVDIEALPEARE
jgi:hypothetical protein